MELQAKQEEYMQTVLAKKQFDDVSVISGEFVRNVVSCYDERKEDGVAEGVSI